VRYRVKGLEAGGPDGVIVRNRVIAKISRTELAEMFVRPAPQALLNKLLEMVCCFSSLFLFKTRELLSWRKILTFVYVQGEITQEQAALAKRVPMCDDIAVEADSGGHTDNRPMVVILPMIMAVRDRVHKVYIFLLFSSFGHK